ncbi:DUF397 domain-containing protein [Streptomyces griseoviridis]|uniref:DUF397 domain-containing protein n=1 Tax=Streptomyces sp. MAA16 TaxID=3035116 RepID=UPI00247388E9|nr:DUF397 domain-containing protein [Streptomyces sp. MAA16]MDH6702209.1 hypothetical protein [Streptomyces sp. MAA16]
MPVSPQPVLEAAWFKSSYSGGGTTECVECAPVGPRTFIRDSKRGNDAVIAVGNDAWRSFVGSLA